MPLNLGSDELLVDPVQTERSQVFATALSLPCAIARPVHIPFLEGELLTKLALVFFIPSQNAVRIADQRRDRRFTHCHGLLEQPQTDLMRQAVALLRIDRLARPHAILPSVPASVRTGHKVVNVALFWLTNE